MTARTSTLHHLVAGPQDGPAIVLVGSLGTTLAMWEPQVAALSTDFRVVAVDLPGHGGTPVPAEPTVPSYADEVVALLDGLGVERFAVVGLSFGGAVAQVLAADHAPRVTRAVVACAASTYDEGFWRERAATVRREGLGPVLELTSRRRFSEAFVAARPEVAQASLRELAEMDPEGYAAVCEALASFGPSVAERIAVPTLVVAGSADQVTPPHLAEDLASRIPDARLEVLGGAGHLASLEQPEAFTALVRAHLA